MPGLDGVPIETMARKPVAFKIRIEAELRQSFVATCHAQDIPAAHVVRKFMREYVSENQHAIQRGLFENTGSTNA